MAPSVPPLSTKNIPVLNGLRVLFLFLIAWYHVWQQSWLTPGFTLGDSHVSLAFIVRSGYIFVDGLLLLSGFLLFLPFARHKVEGSPMPSYGEFYKRRIARILPSYYFAIFFVVVFVALPKGQYETLGDMARDVVMHMTFTHTFSRATYLYTPINGVLWTLGVEVQAYVIMPFVARWFLKKPAVVFPAMVGAGLLYRAGVQCWAADTSMWFNQLPAFFDVYAIGMAGAWLFVKTANRRPNPRASERGIATLLSLGAILAVIILMKSQAAASGSENIRITQMNQRLPLALAIVGLMVTLPFTFRGIRALFGNRVTAFLGMISYNYYIWHQSLALWLKSWGIPAATVLDPHRVGEKSWQIPYTLLCFGLALVVSTVLTYGVEKPAGRWLLNRMENRDKLSKKKG